MNETNEPSTPKFDNLNSDYRFAMYGCAVFLLIFAIGFLAPYSYTRWSFMISVAEQFGSLLCMVFGSMLAFRVYGKFPASIVAVLLLSPLVMSAGGYTTFGAVCAYLMVMNTATKRLRGDGKRVGFFGTTNEVSQPVTA